MKKIPVKTGMIMLVGNILNNFTNIFNTMQPSFNPSDLQKLSDIWSNITNPPTTDPEPEKVEAPETPEVSTETGVEEPEVEANPVQDKLQSSGQFSADELDRIAKADKFR